MKDLKNEIDKFGFAKTSKILSENQIEKLISSLSELEFSSAIREKNGATYGVRNLLNLAPEISELAQSEEVKSLISIISGENAKPVRAIFFDKTPNANWKVPWHQDLTIAIKDKRETSGFRLGRKKPEFCTFSRRF